MPKLILFNRKLNIGSDDFVVPGIFEIFMRSICLLVVVIELGRFHYELDCENDHLIRTYLLGLILFTLVTMVVDGVIVKVSMQGTILNATPRRNIPALLYTRIIVFTLEFLWTLMGTGNMWMQLSECDARVFWLACTAIVGGWIMSIIQVLLVLLSFDWDTNKHQSVFTKHDWEKRWKNLCCCLNAEENKHVFATISKLCVQLFKKEDLVASDVMTGLKLVYNNQRETRQQLDVVDAPLLPSRLRCKPNKSAMSPVTPRKPWMTVRYAAHYMKFALGSYGWPYYIGLNNPVTATCKLLPRLNWSKTQCPSCIENDGKLLANTTAFLLQTGCKLEHIVSACFHNEIYSIPFYVTIDADTQSVVVAIRGTLSLEDILVDLVVERAPVQANGILGSVHTGMLQSAKYIKNKLLTEAILETAFNKATGYRLVITGHSLGAGVASLLAIELRPLYPDLICFAFAPPGELITENLIPYTEEFICSVVLGYDIVPRLGLKEMSKLRKDILYAIKDCRHPKHQVIASGLWTKVFGQLSDHKPDTLDGHSCEQMAAFERYIEEEKADEMRLMSSFIPLLPPGQILHVLEENTCNRPWNVSPEYYAEWTDAHTFSEIVLSTRMIAHHFPDTMLEALRQLAAHKDFNETSHESLDTKKDS